MIATSTRGANLAGLVHFASVSIVLVLQLALLTRFLPPDSAGFWALALTLGNFLLFMDFGFGTAIVRELSFVRSQDGGISRNLAPAAAVFATASRLTGWLSIAAMLLGATCGSILVAQLGGTAATNDSIVGWILFVAGTSASLRSVTCFSAIEGLGFIHVARLVRSAGLLSGLAILGLALLLRGDSLSVGISYLIQGTVMLALSRWTLGRRCPELLSGRPNPALHGRLIRPSAAWALTSLGSLLIFQTGSIVVAWKIGIADVPSFDALARAGKGIMSLALIPALSSMAIIAAHFAAGRKVELGAHLMRNCRHAVMVASVIGTWFAIYHVDIFQIWLGPDRAPPPASVYTYVAMTILETHHGALAYAAIACGYTRFYVPALLAGVLNLSLATAFAADFGIVAISAALMTAQLLTNNWWVPLASLRALGVNVLDYMKGTFNGAIWPLAVATAAQMALSLGASALPMGLRLLCGFCLCVLCLWYLGRSVYLKPD